MAKTNIAETVRALIADTVEALGYRLWDVEFTKIGADRHLIITIDSDTGVDLNACETVHRAVDKILDENDPMSLPPGLSASFGPTRTFSPASVSGVRRSCSLRWTVGRPCAGRSSTTRTACSPSTPAPALSNARGNRSPSSAPSILTDFDFEV